MAGLTPQNTGNRSAMRLGPQVARKLRTAGIKVSPADSKHKRDGIYVAARGEYISVYVDIPGKDVEALARDIADIVKTWGCDPKVDLKVYDDGGHAAFVRFMYKKAVPSKASSTRSSTTPATGDEEWGRVQQPTVQATLLAAGIWTDEGYATEQESTTAVKVTFSVSARDREQLVARINTALQKKKYIVQSQGDALIVRKAKKPKKPSPQERMAQAMAAVEEAPITPEAPAEDLGKPVYHRVTKKLVGYLDEKRFIPIEDVPE